MLRIAADGGFVPPGFIVTRLPRLSVHADGRAIVPGAVPAIYPGPAVSPLIVHRLDAASLERLRVAARTAGLDGPDRTWTAVQAADVETTVLTYVDAAGPHVHAFYALGFQPGPDASTEERAARLAALEFIRAAEDLAAPLPGEVYAPQAYRIYPSPAEGPAPTEAPAPNVLEWPASLPSLDSLEPLPRGPFAARCGPIEGDRLAAFRSVVERATQITRYRSGGQEWTLLIRPLLPDEARSCG